MMDPMGGPRGDNAEVTVADAEFFVTVNLESSPEHRRD